MRNKILATNLFVVANLLAFVVVVDALQGANSSADISQTQLIVSEQEIFKQANISYEKSDYASAIYAYGSLLNSEYSSSEIFYNLGNAYFKNKQIGKAILNYRRALRLAPRDDDIGFNLEYVRSFVEKENPQGFLAWLIWNIDTMLSLNELTVITMIFYFLLITGIIISMFNIIKRNLFWINISSGIVLFICILWLINKIHHQNYVNYAVVIGNNVEVRNGPGKEYSVGFTLPEGKEVIILKDTKPWCVIGVKKEGLKGWTNRDQIEKI